MRRVVSLYLPTWPTDRFRRWLGAAAPPPDAPLVLAGRDRRRRIVVSADMAARSLGLKQGMPLSRARALVPDLRVEEADPDGDAAGLGRLAHWALRRYSPIVAADGSDGLVIDSTGVSHLFGGEAAMLTDLIARLHAVGANAKAAVADTLGAAHAVARYGDGATTIVPPGEIGPALTPLPVTALRLSEDLVDPLRRLGFDAVGDLAAAPRAPLTLRFGPEITRRLDQAFGHVAEPINPIHPPETIGVRRAFAEPIAAPETLVRYTGLLVDALCARLEQDGVGARSLDLLFERVDNVVQAIRIGTAKPVRDRIHGVFA